MNFQYPMVIIMEITLRRLSTNACILIQCPSLVSATQTSAAYYSEYLKICYSLRGKLYNLGFVAKQGVKSGKRNETAGGKSEWMSGNLSKDSWGPNQMTLILTCLCKSSDSYVIPATLPAQHNSLIMHEKCHVGWMKHGSLCQGKWQLLQARSIPIGW